ncbi:hypothetical protein SLITO_v1c01480 [Spiroplasma litorale]|uniref:Uncharacterized protein n=1 Tax=Spiroplasma litorale TaxID=216942 RepID=A0A0K1W0I6_9MOLU|nr:hypothetical protein [Spiroplasma litorale]AKX33814.1 hypothetical protein SLITO_v1c01480 [Spiroplasma litorale]
MSKKDIKIEELAKKRLEEVKKSNELMGIDENIKDSYFVPSRKNPKNKNELLDIQVQKLITPRKKKTLPFSKDQKKEIEHTITLVKNEFKEKEKNEERFEKQLAKERNKVEKLITKSSKKLSSLIKTDNFDIEEVESTLELHDNYLKKMEEIEDGINTLVLKNPNLPLKERRKFIYKRAYNAETERARKLLIMKKNNTMNWADQNYVEEKKGPKRGPSGWKERLGLEEEEDN